MKNTFKKAIKRPLVRYVAVGGVSYILELGLLLSLLGIGVNKLIAVSISFWFGFACAFFLQKIVAFQNKKKQPKQILAQSITYSLLVIINYLFTLGFIVIFSPLLGTVISRTVALIITTLWNFFVYKHLIFTQKSFRAPKINIRNSLLGVIKNLLRYGLLAVPLLILSLPMLSSGTNTVFPGDFDMNIQMTEATKIIILQFHQFPFWNPWIAGGVPLFADPQFNLFSPSTLLSFFMSSAMAWKVSLFIYLLVGFYSMRAFLLFLSRDLLASTLLAYIWILGSFFALRAYGGHFTFILLTLLPLVLHLYFTIGRSWKRALLLGLVLGYCLNAAIHYSTIFTFLTLGALFTVGLILHIAYILVAKKELPGPRVLFRVNLHRLIVASALGFTLALPRILLTVQYLRDNTISRAHEPERFIGWLDGAGAMVLPFSRYNPAPSSFGAFEASNYIGAGTVIVFALLTLVVIINIIRTKFQATTTVYFILLFALFGGFTFVVGVGGMPFNSLHNLPIFSSMRVSTRFFFLTAFALIVLIALFIQLLKTQGNTSIKKKLPWLHATVAVLLCVSLIEVASENYRLNHSLWKQNLVTQDIATLDTTRAYMSPPRSEARWMADTIQPYVRHSLTLATVNNRVQVNADNALVNTDILPTSRCDEDDMKTACRFVMTGNATIHNWSPNKFVISRTGSGPVRLNMNPGKCWTVNGKYIYRNSRTVVTTEQFTIKDDDRTRKYVIECRPELFNFR